MKTYPSFPPPGPTRRALVRTLLLGTVASCALATPSAIAQETPSAARNPDGLEAAGLIVKFRADAADDQLADAIQRGALTIHRHLKTDSTIAVASSAHGAVGAINALAGHPAIEVVEPNWIVRHQATSNDPYYTSGQLWGMQGPANVYGSQAATAWAANYTGSSDVVVAVIDEGIDINHPDLSANIWVNQAEAAGTAGVDDDVNGFVDDVNGWDFFNDDKTVYDGPGDDHATHVAGTIGGIGNNGIGVAGVCWNVKIVSAKFLGSNGGSTADAVDAINYITLLKQRGVNIVASNNSWGGGGYSASLQNAIVNAAKAGVLFVAAAGNSGVDNDRRANYPSNYSTVSGAGYEAVIAVASITSTGAKSSFSCYGSTTVDLGAPGSGIWSTLPGNSYGSYSGTSMATPHVTGAIALYASKHPAATATQIRSALQASVAPTASLNAPRVKVAWRGRLDVGKLLQ